MSNALPRADLKAGRLVVDFAHGAADRRVGFEGIIDRTDLGDVIGLEILDLREQLNGGAAPPRTSTGLPRWSYDKEIDAFYIRITDLEDTASIQVPVVGTAVLDSASQLIRLEVEVGPNE